MDIKEAKKAIKLERAQQDRIPYPSRHHTLLWFIRNLDEAITEIEDLTKTMKQQYEAVLRLEGNIKCTACGAVYPNPHIYPCTL